MPGPSTLPSLGLPSHAAETPHGRAEPTALAPCAHACPLGIDVQRYVGLIKRKHLVPALEVIAEACALPGVCGFLCQRPCERACRRGEVDRPVEIRWLKRAAVEGALGEGGRVVARRHVGGPERVAVVGAGPAGLAAARQLARLGHRVTLLDREARPGGLLEAAVPEHRLPRRALRADVAALLAESDGVELRLGVEVGPGGLEALFREGHGAILLATGAGLEGTPRPPGGHGRALAPVALLKAAARGEAERPGARVAVLGATKVALAAARTLVRLGCDEVTLVASRPRSLWAADPEDVARARAEGVGFVEARLVVAAEEGESGTTLVLAPAEAGRDGLPRAREGETSLLQVDAVVAEAPRRPDLSAVEGERRIARSEAGGLAVDPVTLETSMPGVFAAGECATGPKTVVEALAAGGRAARSVDRFLRGLPLAAGEPRRGEGPAELVVLDGLVEPDEDRALAALTGDLSPLAASEAARRCLRCGPCAECDVCEPGCPHERYVLEAEGGPVVYRAAAGREGGTRLAAVVDERRCTGCGACEVACPHHAAVVRFRASGDALAAIDRPACRGCGLCAAACPFGAVDLSPGLADGRRLAEAIAEVAP